VGLSKSNPIDIELASLESRHCLCAFLKPELENEMKTAVIITNKLDVDNKFEGIEDKVLVGVILCICTLAVLADPDLHAYCLV
jgi:hypothetical protein